MEEVRYKTIKHWQKKPKTIETLLHKLFMLDKEKNEQLKTTTW